MADKKKEDVIVLPETEIKSSDLDATDIGDIDSPPSQDGGEIDVPAPREYSKGINTTEADDAALAQTKADANRALPNPYKDYNGNPYSNISLPGEETFNDPWAAKTVPTTPINPNPDMSNSQSYVQTPVGEVPLNQSDPGMTAFNNQTGNARFERQYARNMPTPYPPDAPRYPEPKPGSLDATRRQLTGAALNNLTDQQKLAVENGEQERSGFTEKEKVARDRVNEDNQQAIDKMAFVKEQMDRVAEKDALRDAAYKKFIDTAGSLKDPSTQYWEDRGAGAKALAMLGAAFSGFGASLSGVGGNPVLDYINKSIEGNYNAHKQNIQDLYQSSVEAGKIVDNAQNRAKFNIDAKDEEYSFGQKHWQHELDAIAANTSSKTVANQAQMLRAQLTEKGIAERQNLIKQEAAERVAALARLRADTKDAREFNLKALSEFQKVDPDTAEVRAAELTADNYPGLAGAPYAVIAEKAKNRNDNTPKPNINQPYQYDEEGKVIIPNKDPATGKRWTDEAVNKYKARAEKESSSREEYDNTLSIFDNALDDVDNISTSLVQGFPGSESRAKRQQVIDKWKSDALPIGAQIYKVRTGRAPQNKKVIEDFLKPYFPPEGALSRENVDVTKKRIEDLRKEYQDTIGPTIPGIKPDTAKKTPAVAKSLGLSESK